MQHVAFTVCVKFMILIAYPASIFEVNKRLSAHTMQSLLLEATAQRHVGMVQQV